MADSPSNPQIRRYYKALPKPARRNLRVKSTSGPVGVLTTIVPWVAPFLLFVLGMTVGSLLDENGLFFGSAIGLAAGVGVGLLLIDQLERVAVRGYVRGHCRDGRLTECPQCDHDQRGTTSAVCPECGCNVHV